MLLAYSKVVISLTFVLIVLILCNAQPRGPAGRPLAGRRGRLLGGAAQGRSGAVKAGRNAECGGGGSGGRDVIIMPSGKSKGNKNFNFTFDFDFNLNFGG